MTKPTPDYFHPVRAGILLGGKSRRMGSPKQLLRLGDETFVEVIARALDACVGRPVLLGAGEVPASCRDLERLSDPPELVGPLAGILAALRHDPKSSWVVVGCDQPLFSREAFEWLIEHRSRGIVAVVPRTPDGRIQPLGAIYEPGASCPLEDIASEGVPAPTRIEGRDGISSPAIPRELARCWRSFDTRDDLLDL